MNKCKASLKTLCAVLCTICLTACEKDLYKPDIPDTPEIEIDWSTRKSTLLVVDVNDAYGGSYYYTVSAYLTNPAVDPDAKMIAGSGQKTNSHVGYSRELVLPNITETIYIAVTDPFKRRRIYAVEVAGETVSFTAGVSVVTKSETVTTRAASIPEVDYTYGNTFVELSGAAAVRIQKGTTYVVKKGKTFSGIMDFPGEGMFNLYVEGTLIWDGSAVTLQKESNVYVLNGGVIKNKSGIRSLTLIGNSQVIVQAGGSFGVGDAGTGFTFSQVTNSSRIINEGTMKVNAISMNSSSSLYNSGTLTCTVLKTENKTNAIVNTHYLEAESISLNNASVANDCMMKVGTFTVVSNGEVMLAPGAYAEVDKLTAAGLKLRMDQQSMWKGEKATFSGQQSVIEGTGADYALFNVDAITVTGWNVLIYNKRVEVEFKSHSRPGPSDKLFTLSNGAAFADGQASVHIPGSDCNGNGGNDYDGEGEGDTDDSYTEESTVAHTYLFEDNWPLKGDYDLNDVVISVEIRNITQGKKTKGARIEANLLAAGGTKTLGAGFQLDGIPASAVSGSESGQEYAVVPLFTNAHAELGAPAGKAVNTVNLDYPAKQIVKEITFATAQTGAVNANNFNLFILLDGSFDGKARNEVHLPGFEGTKLANVNEKSTRKYVDVETGWMWGLAIPQFENITYPKESMPINETYEGFTEWVSGNDTPGWYLHPITNKVIWYQ